MNYHRFAIAVLIFTCSLGVYAQGELGAWEFNQELSLQQVMRDDPDLMAEFAGDYLLVTYPSLHSAGDDCGLVQVYFRDAEGNFEVVQTLRQSDFGTICNQSDGFGYALDYAQGVLAIGAPDQINFADSDTSLSSGGVFIYAEQEDSGFQPVAAFSGTDELGNQAWGTRVTTDGEWLLVQGNDVSQQITSQGRANPRSVNVFVNGDQGWQLSETLSSSVPDMFGQDFAIGDGQLFINQHSFVEETQCLDGRVPGASVYLTEITGYQSSPLGFTASSFLAFDNATQSQSITTRLEQLKTQVDGVDISLLTYRGIFGCGSLVLGLIQLLDEYAVNANNRFVPLGRLFINRGFSRFGPDDQDLAFPSTSSIAASQQFLLGLDLDQQGRSVVTTNRLFTLGGLNGATSEVTQTEFLFGSLDREFIRSASLKINASANLLVLSGNQSGKNRIVIHEKTPALDPAITQAWWFGPEFNGQGVTFEVLFNNRLLMHWFTYDLSGQQMWVRGVGRLENGEINIQLVRAMGPSFGFNTFDADDRVVEPWGQVNIRFDDCRSGVLSYQSDEFGTGELPLVPLTNNSFECGSGTISVQRDDENGVLQAPKIAGSFFDPQRAGEGIILMPIPSEPGIREDGRFTIRDRVVGFWLTYTPTGQQAWYYMGIYETCETMIGNLECILRALDLAPRSTMGPIFGPEYNPDDRVTVLWGTADRFESGFVGQPPFVPLSLLVSNPHGTGRLELQQATLPVGYQPLVTDN